MDLLRLNRIAENWVEAYLTLDGDARRACKDANYFFDEVPNNFRSRRAFS
jgi:hypothetical protein